jgi:hypothetical protein
VKVKNTGLDRVDEGLLTIIAQCSPLLPKSRSCTFGASSARRQTNDADAEQCTKECANHGPSAGFLYVTAIRLSFITEVKLVEPIVRNASRFAFAEVRFNR